MVGTGGFFAADRFGWGRCAVIRQRSREAELAEAQAAVAAGKYAKASDRLSRLATHWTSDGLVFVLLGESELARGKNEPPERKEEVQAAAAAALAAWAKVPAKSPHFGRACLLSATHLINTRARHAG